MDKNEDIISLRPWGSGTPAGTDDARATPENRAEQVAFDRRELNIILGIYGTKVAAGEWRDYAIDFLKDRAVFSIFRRASEIPIYRIEKDPRLARKQGSYSVIAANGQILRRGHDLERVLLVADPEPRRWATVVEALLDAAAYQALIDG